jgi:uncharacterized caspase-like protein
MRWRYSSLFVFLIVFGSHLFGQDRQKRIALVIGIQSYASSPLQNSLKDAHDMAAVLKSKDFQVIELYDPSTKKEIKDAILNYFDLMSKYNGAIGLLYYSGHGMQVDGINYLIPTTANPQVKADIEEECLRLDYIMQVLEEAGNSLNIMILDACRNNPFRSFSRSTEKGLSMVNTPRGSYIVYATKPGSVASDGTGGNGLFTSKLLKYIQVPNLKVEEVFKLVLRDVSLESNNAQRPWIASDYDGDFYFTTESNILNPNPSAPNTQNSDVNSLSHDNNQLAVTKETTKPKIKIWSVPAHTLPRPHIIATHIPKPVKECAQCSVSGERFEMKKAPPHLY